jgi:quinol monooxygenase YgiN
MILKGASKMIKIVAKGKLKPGVKEEYLQLARELVTETRKENGCISYSIYEDINDPSILTMLEEWVDEDAINLHNNSEHVMRIVPELRKLRESVEINLYRAVFND